MSPHQATRRHGATLLEAVHAAALDEVADLGLRGATMDGIAARAGTGKATLYRRWPNLRALTLDVFLTTLERAVTADFPDTGSIRNDLLASMDDFTKAMEGSLGVVLRELISEAAHDPSLVEQFQVRFGGPHQARIASALQRAMARGEIPTRPIEPLVLDIPEALVVHRVLLTGHPPTPAECQHLIDRVMMPLLQMPN